MNKFLSSKDAAQYLGYSHKTLANSRNLGILAGVKAPSYKKMGTAIRYEVETLDEWSSQFSELENTKQA